MSTDLNWFKSSYSGSQGGDCVEVATCTHTVHVRDSKDISLPSLSLTPTAWSAFLQACGDTPALTENHRTI